MPIVAAALLPDVVESLRPERLSELEALAAEIAATSPEAFVFAGRRHLDPRPVSNAYVAAPTLAGDLRYAGYDLAPHAPVDLALAESVIIAAADCGVPLAATPSFGFALDEGLLVPMYHAMRVSGVRPALGLLLMPEQPAAVHRRLGVCLAAALRASAQRVALICGGGRPDPNAPAVAFLAGAGFPAVAQAEGYVVLRSE